MCTFGFPITYLVYVNAANLVALMRKTALSWFREDWTYIRGTGDISICVLLLGKQSLPITLSCIMGCEKCDWTSVAKDTEQWRDGSRLRVINICRGVGSACDGRLIDASITSAVSLTLSTWCILLFMCKEWGGHVGLEGWTASLSHLYYLHSVHTYLHLWWRVLRFPSYI